MEYWNGALMPLLHVYSIENRTSEMLTETVINGDANLPIKFDSDFL